MNKLFQETQQNSLLNKIRQFMQNPVQAIMQSRMNIPQQYQNDPHGAVEYLIQSGQISQDDLNKAVQTAQKLGFKL